MKLRTGYTTGACAAAAAKAAALRLCTGVVPTEVDIALPEGVRAVFPVAACDLTNSGVQAAVCKDAGDDPDVTHQSWIVVEVAYEAGDEVRFVAGDGVGTVTKPGLSVPPGEAAINPVPRRLICAALREVSTLGLRVTVSIPGGRELAARTFNPRLGIEGGLSILGTTGIVKPFSATAVTASLQCALDVAAASGVRAPVLVPGNIGERAALRNLRLAPGQIIQVSNHWGFMLDQAARETRFESLLVLGHPGKLAKLVDGDWDTHSSNSASATAVVARIDHELPGAPAPASLTVEGIFAACDAARSKVLGDALAARVHAAISARIGAHKPLTVALVNMPGAILGSFGDMQLWK
jgi:cobalt-precorrin-5B (C1)-methyltransferase